MKKLSNCLLAALIIRLRIGGRIVRVKGNKPVPHWVVIKGHWMIHFTHVKCYSTNCEEACNELGFSFFLFFGYLEMIRLPRYLKTLRRLAIKAQIECDNPEVAAKLRSSISRLELARQITTLEKM